MNPVIFIWKSPARVSLRRALVRNYLELSRSLSLYLYIYLLNSMFERRQQEAEIGWQAPNLSWCRKPELHLYICIADYQPSQLIVRCQFNVEA